jgi:hypothetical protein
MFSAIADAPYTSHSVFMVLVRALASCVNVLLSPGQETKDAGMTGLPGAQCGQGETGERATGKTPSSPALGRDDE